MTELKILSKNGISNYCINCSISVVIHSLFGTAVTKSFPSFSNYNSPAIQKAVDVCKSKIRCPKRVEERLNKRKPVILTESAQDIIKRFNGDPFKEKNRSQCN